VPRDRDDDREIVLVERDSGSRLGPLVLGLALGVGLGLLFAPRSGEDTRRVLRRRWRRLRAAAEDQAEMFGERLSEGVDRLRSGAWLEDDDEEDEDELEAERPPVTRSAPGSAREELERRLTRSRARRRAPGKPPAPPTGQEPVA